MTQNRKEFRLRPLIIYYMMLFYILASLAWWTYLLMRNAETGFRHGEKELVTKNPGTSLQAIRSSEPYRQLQDRHRRQRLMIIGESSIFLALLVLGAVRIRRSYIQELELARQHRNFLLSIKHELKSPLSSIRLGLETLSRQKLDPESQQRIIANSVEDTDRLQSLVEDILLAARFEDEGHTFTTETVDLSSVVLQVSEARIGRAEASHVLKSDVESDVIITADRQAMTIVTGNLVENAIKYSPVGSTIYLSLHRKDSRVVLSVADEGHGIPPSERKKIFRRFYRIGNEDTRKTKGTGLGLFIVKQIVEGHGGKVRVSEREGGGARFEVSLRIR